MPEPVSLRLTGRELDPALPAFLQSASRGSDAAQDEFLPAGYLKPVKTFDVGPAARDIAGAKDAKHDTQDDEIVVLELTDGSTFITSAARLRESLAQSHPEMLGPNGEILLEKLQQEGIATRGVVGDAIGGLVRKIFTFVVGAKQDDIIAEAAKKLAADKVKDVALLGVSRLGARALMWAIEKKLDQPAGALCQWIGSSGKKDDLKPVDISAQALADPASKPLLVFVHGTGSSSLGSFGELRKGEGNVWAALEQKFGDRIYAFEHRTLSESPIQNAIQLVKALPVGAHVSLVSHSRGGLVADLVCLESVGADLIARYAFDLEGTGAPPDPRVNVLAELNDAHAEQRKELADLAKALAEKQLVIERYVRTASPANGTKLASGNFDVFLSGLLSLIGAVPFLFGSPFYGAFKRVVVEIAKNRTDPHLVPGIEAMLPDSPMARLLRDAKPAPGIKMAVIAGDIEGGNLLKRLGVLLTDFLLFDNTDNDLVVDTKAMLAGIAPTLQARVLFDRGADVSHFKYFVNHDTRSAMRSWLVAEDLDKVDVFRKLPSPEEYAQYLEEAVSRDAITADKPVVVVLPGVMGSHLNLNGKDRVWLDPGDIATGGLAKIKFGVSGVEAEDLFALSYGALCKELSASHIVRRFPYDWRQPLDVLGDRLGEFLSDLLKQTKQPIRLIAHSMGGLVVRACIAKRRAVMDELMQREGARLVMCGTPHQGAHSMVENLIGKGDTLRMLVRLDLKHDMQEVLDIVSGFRGPLQLLPKPGFVDTFQGQPDGGQAFDYSKAETWQAFAGKVKDFWFGDGRCGKPTQAVLDSASWLWKSDGMAKPSLPNEDRYLKKSVYVFGVAPNTPCGIREENGRLKMVGTTRGDGTVTWDSGRIDGIGSFYYLPAVHGDLLATKEYFPGLIDLLTSGITNQLLSAPPATRAIEQAVPVVYDAGPPALEDPVMLSRAVVGGSMRNRLPPRRTRRLEVAIKAMDLRFLNDPIMVGHYEQDPISGPEALIDRELFDGDLSERHTLGLYAGPRGTAVVVLRAPNGYQPLRGAIVTGLGPYEGMLSVSQLTESVRTGVLRYLLQIVDVLGTADREVSLSTLLLGYNSSANLSIAASVEALVRGTMEANARFYETTRQNIRVSRLNIVEVYVDTAITAVYALRQLPQRIAGEAQKLSTTIVVRGELEQGEGMRQRLFDSRAGSYWPRLMITDAQRNDDDCSPEAPAASATRLAPATAPGTAAGTTPVAPAAGAAPIASRLRFLYVGQRARAESVVQQRQPGLIESIVRQQIRTENWSEDLGRMLFQLMVPHDFKDAARQLERVVMVVDSYTANLPWELMLADDPARPEEGKLPLAMRTPMVRQLSSTRFRRVVRQAMRRTALVIGNPSVEKFKDSFAGPGNEALNDPPNLEGAEREAQQVESVLRGMGYTVASVIGSDRRASDVLALLYRDAYRILHISAHGVFDLPHKDGLRRSGVVLSDGLLITAAEIDAMETVPELVFLNCCHLAKMDEVHRDGNKLAASIARQLIEIGVRCVVVAGWAVNDEMASMFGQVFYGKLLMERMSFGDAVYQARKAVGEANLNNITWGAFQAYGDPGWRAEPQLDGMGGGSADTYASPSELLDDLARARAEFSRKRDLQSARESKRQIDAIEATLKKRCPPAWLSLPQLQSALGATWRDVDQFDKARESFLAAIRAEDKVGYVPIRDIEQLANVEARMGERSDRVELIDLALRRLKTLNDLVADAADSKEKAIVANAERSALRGSAYKRKASLFANHLLAKDADARTRADAGAQMKAALEMSSAAYREAEGAPGSSTFVPYNALNRLAIDALLPLSESLRAAAVDLAQQCRKAAAERYAAEGGIWDNVMQPESLLIERLIDGKLGAAGAAGDAVLEEVALAYSQALAEVTIKPSQLDSVVTQMTLLSKFYDALSVADGDPAKLRTADRLLALRKRVHPGSADRKDRPATASARKTAAKATTKTARRARTSPAKRAKRRPS